MRKVSMRYGVVGLALAMSAHSAGAHGIAGNRFFVGTLTFDDPAVADEAILPGFSRLDHSTVGGNALTIGLIGPLSGCSRRRLRFPSIVAGFIEAGPAPRYQGSIQRT
jgi:hypothetical protein